MPGIVRVRLPSLPPIRKELYEVSISDILFVCFLAAIACMSIFYLVGVLVQANKKYSPNQFEEARKKRKQENDEWDQRRKRSQQEFDAMFAEMNKRNAETIERIREHLRRLQEEQYRRMGEEYQRRASAATTEKQKLLTYMNVVGISNYPFTKEEISKKRRILSLKYHPDRNGGKDDKMKKVNEACDYLEKVAEG